MIDPSYLFNLMGYSAGIGLELKVTDRVSLHAEAARMTLFNTQIKGPNLDGISLNFGIKYSFGGYWLLHPKWYKNDCNALKIKKLTKVMIFLWKLKNWTFQAILLAISASEKVPFSWIKDDLVFM